MAGARDALETRLFTPTVPRDANDPPRYAQLAEVVKDSLVEELRAFLVSQGISAGRHTEAVTLEKYATDFIPGLDPYQTYVKIVQDFPDVRERLPHIAVTTAAGSNARMTAGRPFIAHTQLPPRVTTTVAGPYVLANPLQHTYDIAFVSVPGTYAVAFDGAPAIEVTTTGDRNDAAARLAEALRAVVGELYDVTASTGPAAGVQVVRRDAGQTFSLAVSSNLTATVVQAAGAATEPAKLVYRTTPQGSDGLEEHVSEVTFLASRFATAEPLSAVPAAALARVFNEQALYAEAVTVGVGVGTGVQFQTGGALGQGTPNEVEILPESTPALLTALGLAVLGTAGVGASIGGTAPTMTLNVPGATFTSALIGRNLRLDGTTSAANEAPGRVTAVAGPTQLTFTNPDGVPEALPTDASYFLGARDDSKNPARPVMNRYHIRAQLQVTIDILAESPNERRELTDLVFSEFLFWLEQKHFTLYGRGVFDEAYPDEHYQVVIHQEVQAGAEQTYPRGDDQKNMIHASRINLPVTCTMMLDRPVTALTGPSAGQSWTLESENVEYDESLPLRS